MNDMMVSKESKGLTLTRRNLRAWTSASAALLLAVVLACTGVPSVAIADEAIDDVIQESPSVPDMDGMPGNPGSDEGIEGDTAPSVPDATSLTISGVDFMQPFSESWEVFRVDNLADQSLYLDVERVAADGTATSLVKRGAYVPTASDDAGEGEEVAQIITVDLSSSVKDALGNADQHDTYRVSAYSERRGGTLLYEGVVYPVYAALQANDGSINYELLGIRTTHDEGATSKNVGAGEVFYKQDEDGVLDAYVREAVEGASVDNYFDATSQAFYVPYIEQAAQALTGSIRYVDEEGMLVKETFVRDFVNGEAAVRVEDSFIIVDEENPEATRYYRALSTLGGTTVTLTAANAHAVIRVVEIEKMAQTDYSVTLRYIDENGELLWSDPVDVKGYGYQYTLPTTFSMLETDGVEMYTLQAVEGKSAQTGDEGTEAYSVGRDWGIPTIKFDNTIDRDRDFLKDEDGNYYVNARYTSSSFDGKATLKLVAMDGSTGEPLPEAYQPAPMEITREQGASYTPQSFEIDGVTYVPWSGNTEPITYTWDDLALGIDLLQYVYYVPEGYAPEAAYDVTVQYVDIATGAVLRTDTHAISPELSGYMTINSEERFTANGNEYVRLAGQELGIRHGYYSPARTYTVYYRDVNDVINADTIIYRTQIIETERVVMLPGSTTTTVTTIPGTVTTITSAPQTLPTVVTPEATTTPASAVNPGADTTAPAPAEDTAAPTTEVGVSAGDGAVVINDDNNPLANQSGQQTAVERTIADNETPLADLSGASASAGSGLVEDSWNRDTTMLLVSAGGAVLAGLAAWMLIRRNKRKQYSNTIGSDRMDL